MSVEEYRQKMELYMRGNHHFKVFKWAQCWH